ncbi:hypothetical protein BV25DRAFT_1822981, partial [Artomyces pyxidatus]
MSVANVAIAPLHELHATLNITLVRYRCATVTNGSMYVIYALVQNIRVRNPPREATAGHRKAHYIRRVRER